LVEMWYHRCLPSFSSDHPIGFTLDTLGDRHTGGIPAPSFFFVFFASASIFFFQPPLAPHHKRLVLYATTLDVE
jgi:hypothetical protein